MNYQIEELIRGIASGKVNEDEARQLITDFVTLQVRLAKLLKPMYDSMTQGGLNPVMPSNG
jgi:hypothetical protein